ncbi:MAG TPA: phosphate ABC transporter ATP-binding protein PstB [Candidatus Omnitrophota bacterium]|nr:phosphate ABC transporter ATP-binding protein PstB [Candidatus Omnitrophota bacterium]HQJ15900.1 phosphate ABC transporter ATP-binding protein PstB [Candidatus Omnitrophota bacterium]
MHEKMNAKMEAREINFYYGAVRALKNINMSITGNTVTAIIGPSGCGKSTFIRLLNRMHELVAGSRVEGHVYLDGKDILDPTIDAVDVRRSVGMVFQKPNPFPKTIFENISYGLTVNNVRDKDYIEAKVVESLKKAALWDEVKDRLKDNALRLSGGQQQRLCIARCLAVGPEVLLFDEPCASLDPISTGKIEELMLELKKNYTIVIVTHNMQQAARVSDTTGFFLMGELIEFGKTQDIFTAPKNKQTEAYITGRFG